MVNDFNLTDTHHFLPSLGDLELLEVLLSAEDTTYPWDIADAQTEVYLQQIEQQVIQQDFLPLTEIAQREANFFRHLDMIWEKIPDNNPRNISSTSGRLPAYSLKPSFRTICSITLVANYYPQSYSGFHSRKIP